MVCPFTSNGHPISGTAYSWRSYGRSTKYQGLVRQRLQLSDRRIAGACHAPGRKIEGVKAYFCIPLNTNHALCQQRAEYAKEARRNKNASWCRDGCAVISEHKIPAVAVTPRCQLGPPRSVAAWDKGNFISTAAVIFGGRQINFQTRLEVSTGRRCTVAAKPCSLKAINSVDCTVFGWTEFPMF